jgi:hypothetical protein
MKDKMFCIFAKNGYNKTNKTKYKNMFELILIIIAVGALASLIKDKINKRKETK